MVDGGRGRGGGGMCVTYKLVLSVDRWEEYSSNKRDKHYCSGGV